MSCDNCGDKSKNAFVDRYGNKVSEESSLSRYERTMSDVVNNKSVDDISYVEYLKSKEILKERSIEIRNVQTAKFSEEYKRIQIDQLISVINVEEVHAKLSPEQALVALWDILHHKDYSKVSSEFVGLVEEVDRRYSALQANKLKFSWLP